MYTSFSILNDSNSNSNKILNLLKSEKDIKLYDLIV